MRTCLIFALRLAFCLAVTYGLQTAAQQTSVPAPSERILAASELTTKDPEIRRRAFANPQIAPDHGLRGESLLQALRAGGLTLFMRHTQAGTITEHCETSNLSQAGERDARFVGESIKALGIPVGSVETSPVCRSRDTAILLGLGTPKSTLALSNNIRGTTEDLESLRSALIKRAPLAGTNTMLVSHLHAGKQKDNWIQMDLGEIVVFKSDGKGRSDAIARIAPDDWYDLLAIAKKR